MYLYLKSAKAQKYIPEETVIQLDWTMSMEDYVWFLFAGMWFGAAGVLIYLTL